MYSFRFPIPSRQSICLQGSNLCPFHFFSFIHSFIHSIIHPSIHLCFLFLFLSFPPDSPFVLSFFFFSHSFPDSPFSPHKVSARTPTTQMSFQPHALSRKSRASTARGGRARGHWVHGACALSSSRLECCPLSL